MKYPKLDKALQFKPINNIENGADPVKISRYLDIFFVNSILNYYLCGII